MLHNNRIRSWRLFQHALKIIFGPIDYDHPQGLLSNRLIHLCPWILSSVWREWSLGWAWLKSCFLSGFKDWHLSGDDCSSTVAEPETLPRGATVSQPDVRTCVLPVSRCEDTDAAVRSWGTMRAEELRNEDERAEGFGWQRLCCHRRWRDELERGREACLSGRRGWVGAFRV